MTRPTRIALPLLLVLMGSVPACFGGDANVGDGAEVRAWTDLQKSGAAASPVARPLPGEIADRTYQRYADSFAQPIPDQLTREGFVSKSGGGGSGSGSRK